MVERRSFPADRSFAITSAIPTQERIDDRRNAKLSLETARCSGRRGTDRQGARSAHPIFETGRLLAYRGRHAQLSYSYMAVRKSCASRAGACRAQQGEELAARYSRVCRRDEGRFPDRGAILTADRTAHTRRTVRNPQLHLSERRHPHRDESLGREDRSAHEAFAARRMLVQRDRYAQPMGAYLGV